MDKALIVAAPLLLYGLLTALRAVAGRLPSRVGLNVELSLLLLGYVLATVSLGVFWVANQQLPPFDWHYLAGYGTAALIVVHLAFNLRVVLAHFKRREQRPSAAREQRARAALGPWLLGSGLIAAVAFYLGVRAGGTTFVLGEGQPPTQGLIERLHEFSSHSRAGVALRAPSVSWETPARDRRPRPSELVRLPPPDLGYRRLPSLSQALSEPVSEARGEASLGDLSLLLFAAAGITERRGGLSLRAAASSGALFPNEVYVLAAGVAGLAPGAYSYRPEEHALAPVEGTRLELERSGVSPSPELALIVTSVFQRTGQKYRDRTYRYVAADAGHVLGNVLAAAAELGLAAKLEPRFDEAAIARGLAVDEREEGVMSVVSVLAPPSRAASAAAASLRPAPAEDPRSLALGVTTLAHLATSLRASDEAPIVSGGPSLSPAAPAPDTTFRALARRRSVRTFDSRPLPAAELASVLRFSAGPSPELSRAVRVHVIAGNVAGLPPGVYEYHAPSQRLLSRRSGDFRAAAGRAALDQEVVAGAHAVFVLTIDRRALELEGPRGYRHAFIEAGLIGARVYLEAAARALGACSVGAFYDREAAELIGVDPGEQWPIHFTALGTLPSTTGSGAAGQNE